MLLPTPKSEKHAQLIVVRDDLLPGGTKRRFVQPLFEKHAEVVYASPAEGGAQLALAHSAKAAGKLATLFVPKRNVMHPKTAMARELGAQVFEVEAGRLSVLQARAREHAAKAGAYLMPWGADMPEAREAIAEAARSLQLKPLEVWCAAGSGTLTRALQLAWPEARHVVVGVGAETNPGKARVIKSPLQFGQQVAGAVPFPSCRHYDAKALLVALRLARPGALFWNVAGDL